MGPLGRKPAAKSPTAAAAEVLHYDHRRRSTYSTTRPSARWNSARPQGSLSGRSGGPERPDRIRLVALTESILLQVQELRVGGRAGVPAGDSALSEVAKATGSTAPTWSPRSPREFAEPVHRKRWATRRGNGFRCSSPVRFTRARDIELRRTVKARLPRLIESMISSSPTADRRPSTGAPMSNPSPQRTAIRRRIGSPSDYMSLPDAKVTSAEALRGDADATCWISTTKSRSSSLIVTTTPGRAEFRRRGKPPRVRRNGCALNMTSRPPTPPIVGESART